MPRGRPKCFGREEFGEYITEYLNGIFVKQDAGEKDAPTFYGFYQFVQTKKKCSYHTVRRCFDEYWADLKKEFENTREDLLARGGIMGLYNSTMTIFALKHWCKWRDQVSEEEHNTDGGVIEIPAVKDET